MRHDRDLAQLLGDDEPMVLVRDQHGRGEALGLDDPMNGLLQQTFVAEQG